MPSSSGPHLDAIGLVDCYEPNPKKARGCGLCAAVAASSVRFPRGAVAMLRQARKEKDIVPSVNTNKGDSIASKEKVGQLITGYMATLFINHDKSQTDGPRLFPALYE
jgi:hypothetical protein